MGSQPSPPPAPDPTATAAAQAASNKQTAIAQYGLNATNQITPYGNLSYTQSGTWADGTPRFTATQTLSPEQQQLYNQYTSNQLGLGQMGGEQISRLRGLLGQPVSLTNEAAEGRLAELGRARLDPLFQQRREAMRTQLYNQGVREGTQAWDEAMKSIGQQENDAYNQLFLTGRGQSIQELLAQRNQPINEITALMSGSQVSQPSFTNTPQTSVAPTNVLGAYELQQNALQNAYNQQMGQQNALYGALGSLGGAALGGWGMGGFKMPKWGV